MRYRCLVFDHDDTSVDSTAHIHYPAHVATVKELLPGREPVSLEQWFHVNHEPGVRKYLHSLFRKAPCGRVLSEEEYKEVEKREIEVWRGFMRAHTPSFYPGILEGMRLFRERGGLVCVVSHSPADVIELHYAGSGFMPDLVIGWSDDQSKNKPHAFPCLHIMEKFGLQKEDLLVIDDLTPGVKMASKAEVKSAAACWAHACLERQMRECGSTEVFATVRDMWLHVFDDCEKTVDGIMEPSGAKGSAS